MVTCYAEILILQPSRMQGLALCQSGYKYTQVFVLSVLYKRILISMFVMMWKMLGSTALEYKLLQDKRKVEFTAHIICVWEHFKESREILKCPPGIFGRVQP